MCECVCCTATESGQPSRKRGLNERQGDDTVCLCVDRVEFSSSLATLSSHAKSTDGRGEGPGVW